MIISKISNIPVSNTNKTKIVIYTGDKVIKDVVCKSKDVTDDKIILKYKKEYIIEIKKGDMENILVNNEETNLVKIEIQKDARLINRGKECKNYSLTK